MENLRSIIDEHNHSVDFPLFDTTFTVSAERNIYNQLKKKYEDLANSAKRKFAEYDAQFEELNDLIVSAPGALILALEEALNEASRDAISVGLYALDSETIMEECFKGEYFEKFTKIYKTYVAVHNKTIKNLADAAHYREQRKQSRGHWTSATWGGNAFDAWGNQMKCSAMNITEGIGHSFINAIGNINDEIDAEDNLKAFFKDRGLRNSLIDSVWYCCVNLHMVVIKLVSKQRGLHLGGEVTNDDAAKAKAMYNNLVRVAVPVQKQQQFAYEIITLNPYISDYYGEFFRRFSDFDLQVIKIADFFYVTGIRDETKKSLVYFVNNNIGTTEEDAYKCKEMLESKADRWGLSNEDRQEALQIINEQLRKIDLEYRTVDGVVLDTRTNADATRKDVVAYKDILEKPHVLFVFRRDYLSHIETIRQLPVAGQIKNKYINQYQSHLSDFDKKCKKAARYEYQRKHRNLFWNGDTADMLLHIAIIVFFALFVVLRIRADWNESSVAIIGGVITWGVIGVIYWIFKQKREKKIWDEVTQNEKYEFEEIIKK